MSLGTQPKLTMATAIITIATLLLHTNLVVPIAAAAVPIDALGKMSPGEAVAVGNNNNNNNFMAVDEAPDAIASAIKRAASKYNFGLGKRAEDILNDLYSPQEEEAVEDIKFIPLDEEQADTGRYVYDIPEKRAPSQRFSFGLGKKSYNAALPKRTPARHYQFGLGKRAWFNSLGRDGKKKKVTNYDEFMKRRYSFGLGKRSV